VSFSPQDTILGTKTGGGAGGITMANTYNINVPNKEEMERIIREENSRMIDELRRNL